MMIIRYSRECKWVTTCPKCGCVFVYTGADIQKTTADEFYGFEKQKVQIGKEVEPVEVSFVECPECHYPNRIANLAMYRKPADGIRTDEWEEVD
jgi:hypothetical protein